MNIKRYKKVLDMRESGLTFKQIADDLGISVTRARYIFSSAERRLMKYGTSLINKL